MTPPEAPGGTPPEAPGGKPYARLSPLTPVVRAPILLLAVLGGSWQQILRQDDVGFTGLLLVGLLVAGGGYGVASWLMTKYWIDGDELRIDTGVLVRQSRRIRIDRLQGVDIVQPLVARLFGLAEVRFDLASGGDREGSLAFLPHSRALELRRLLLERRDDLRGSPSGTPVPPGAAGEGPGADGSPAGVLPAGHADATLGTPAPPRPDRVLARLDLGRLLASLALSTETLWLGGAALALGATFLATGTFAAAGGILPALAALALTLGRKLTAYYGFTLSDTPAGLQVRRGLTSLSSQTIAPVRIQGMVVAEPLLWRRLGWARLETSVAGYQQGDADLAQGSSTLMPVAPKAEVLAVVRQVLEGRDMAAVPLVRPPRRARMRAPLTAWTLALGQDERLLVSRRGFWVRRTDVVPHARVQSLRITQGPLQRRLRLADVHVDSPPGPVGVHGLQRDPAEARAFVAEAVALGRRARQQGAAAQDPWAPPTEGVTPPAPDTTQ